MLTHTLSSTLDRALAGAVPGLLFHYTSSEGLIGILRTRELWASNVAFFNDVQEVELGVGLARVAIENTIKRVVNEREAHALQEMHAYVGGGAKRYYVFSLTEEEDLLSQWRAYSPPGGGYAIGFPSKQLSLMAEAQGFMLARCIYDEYLQCQIVQEFVNSFLSKFRDGIALGLDEEDLTKQIAWEFGQHITRFGLSLKHKAFHEEKEWRLISPPIQEPHPQLDYRPSSFRIVPFFRFHLTENHHSIPAQVGEERLTVIVGPTSDPAASQMALQFLLTSLVGNGALHRRSEIPYRNW